MIYLNGGPGMECRPPQQYPFTQRILEAGYQLFFLDQRGTGFSSPITASTLQMLQQKGPNNDNKNDEETQTQNLKLYRADNIVRDCEAIRQILTADYPSGPGTTTGASDSEKKKWSTIGQSFGGFITMTYLSFYPQGLRESFIFGGLQPLVQHADQVYKSTFRKVAERNRAYYDKYPEDVARVRNILAYLVRGGGGDGEIGLPSGGKLTRRRFRAMGIMLGMHGGLDSVHEIVHRANNDIELFGHLTRGTLSMIDAATSYDDHLIYAILHEPIYCNGPGTASRWSAERVQAEFAEFDIDRADGPIYFTGEMIYPWMFEDYAELRKVRDTANRVAAEDDWPALFDREQLARNEVPVYAASYVEDMYVDFGLGSETAKSIKGAKVFVTNVMFHDAIRSRMDEVVKQAFALRDDVLD